MANPIKGEVAFESDGKQYTFVLGTYALAALQRRTGVSTFKFFAKDPKDWGVDDMLAVFHAGLLRHHKLSEEQAADIIDDIGQPKVGGLIREAIQLAFPDQKEDARGTARPPISKPTLVGDKS